MHTAMDAVKEIMPGIFVVEQREKYAGIMQTNPYVIVSEDGLIFLDPGFPLEETEDVYRSLIRSCSKQPLVVLLTHGHTDHYGMAGFLQKEFDIPVWVHRADHDRVAKGVSLDLQAQCEQLLMCWQTLGMSRYEKEWALTKVKEFNVIHHDVGALNVFEDGHLFCWGGVKLMAVQTPGHTLGSCCFYDPEQKRLFSGDTLFPPTLRTPLPGSLFGDPDGSIDVYLASLERLRGLNVETIFPGHGEPFQGYRERLHEAFTYYRVLTRKIAATVSKTPLLSAVELAASLMPEADDYVRFILTGEVSDVLEVLKRKQIVESIMDNGVIRWKKT